MFCHERDAFDSMVELSTPHLGQLPPVVIHCFTGKAHQAEKYLQMGFYIGLTGYLWKDKRSDGVRHRLQREKLRLYRLLLETDGPFMFPNIQAKKHHASVIESLTQESCDILKKYSNFQRTEPSAMCIINELVAAFIGKEPKEVADKAFQNAVNIFNLR
ncbi:unnamed protein product [Owenia fusiformis]|uniref:Deoxyribonuclease TATDN1 n=1 Tax=Owenia fusiformis TaxID=6347 RepID=A0A8S4PNW0_OWEFU|nr:unnamed protein product [Owenia fusiformis]